MVDRIHELLQDLVHKQEHGTEEEQYAASQMIDALTEDVYWWVKQDKEIDGE